MLGRVELTGLYIGEGEEQPTHNHFHVKLSPNKIIKFVKSVELKASLTKNDLKQCGVMLMKFLILPKIARQHWDTQEIIRAPDERQSLHYVALTIKKTED